MSSIFSENTGFQEGQDPGGNSAAGESYVVFSPETPPVMGTYLVKTSTRDAPHQAVGQSGDGSVISNPDSRCWLDFDAGDNGSGAASQESVTLTRNNSGSLTLPLRILKMISPMLFGKSRRIVWTGLRPKSPWKYLDSEIAGISGVEGDLGIFSAAALSGPLDVSADDQWLGARNELRATVSGFSFFAFGNDNTIPVEVSGFAIDWARVSRILAGILCV
jgi:hypothetical protein